MTLTLQRMGYYMARQRGTIHIGSGWYVAWMDDIQRDGLAVATEAGPYDTESEAYGYINLCESVKSGRTSHRRMTR